MSKLFSRKHSDNSSCRSRNAKTPMSMKENEQKFKYPKILKDQTRVLQVQTNQVDRQHSELRSPSAMSNMTQSPINKSILVSQRSHSMFQDAQYVEFVITNKEVTLFLKKHFLHEHLHTGNSRQGHKLICDSWDKVPVAIFIKSLFLEYPDIIEDQNDAIRLRLKQHIKDLVSEEGGQILSLNKLQLHTRQLGLLGLLLSALRDIQSPNMINIIPTKEHLQQQVDDICTKAEAQLMDKINIQMKVLQQKSKDAELLFNSVKGRVNDNFDLFQHEAKTKAIIVNLRQQLQLKDQRIQELEQKLNEKQRILDTSAKKSLYSSIDEDNNKSATKANVIHVSSTIQSPFHDSGIAACTLLQCVLNSWDQCCIQEEYRFAQILMAQDNNQMPFQHFQMIPVIKSIPGFSELAFRTQACSNLLINWIQNALHNAEQPTLLIQYQQIILLLPSLKVTDSEQYLCQILQLFLKLSVSILIIKSVFNLNKLKEWMNQSKRQHDTQINNLVTQIISISNFTVTHVPQSRQWNQQHQLQEQQEQYKLIENPIVVGVFMRLLNKLLCKPNIGYQLHSIIKTLQSIYSLEPEECIELMQQVQGESEYNICISKLLLDCDVVNLIIFPQLRNPKFTLRLVNILLSFKCPGQYYMTYTKQVCHKQNIDILVDLLTRFHNTNNQELIIKIWEIVGAIAKSVCLKECKDSLQFVIRMYSNIPIQNVVQNMQQVLKNLSSTIPI